MLKLTKTCIIHVAMLSEPITLLFFLIFNLNSFQRKLLYPYSYNYIIKDYNCKKKKIMTTL